jgi:hypothetical protein
MPEICDRCERTMDKKPIDCGDRDHWASYAKLIEQQRDEALAKLDEALTKLKVLDGTESEHSEFLEEMKKIYEDTND